MVNNLNSNATRKVGIIHEEQCKLYFLSLGYDISVPIGESSSYDFILDIGSKLLKIQCKKPRYYGGSISFDGSTTKPNKDGIRRLDVVRYSFDKVDYFASYYDGICYLVPYDSSTPRHITLRIEYPKNRAGLKAIRWAEEYEGSYIIDRLLNPSIPKRSGQRSFEKYINYERSKSKGDFIWITNGQVNHQLYQGEIPEGFWRGRSGKTNGHT